MPKNLNYVLFFWAYDTWFIISEQEIWILVSLIDIHIKTAFQLNWSLKGNQETSFFFIQSSLISD